MTFFQNVKDLGLLFNPQNRRDFYTGVSQSAEQFGNERNLPELNISEFLSGMSIPKAYASDITTTLPDNKLVGPPMPDNLQKTTTTNYNSRQTPVSTDNVPTPQGPSEEELNAIFAPSQSYLSEAESRLRQDYPSILSDIRSQYGVGEKQLQSGKAQTERTIGEAETGARTRKQESEAAARRLFQELGMGGRQRFGGASSAGEAFGQINALEQQRRARDIAGNFNTAKREIDNQRVSLEENYQNSLLQLQSQRDQAINQAQRDFQNKLLEIGRLRAENESAKASARLEALQALRNQVYQIQLQNQQFQQTLQSQATQQAQQLSQAEAALADRAQGAMGAQSTFAGQTTLTPGSSLQGYGNTQGSTPAQLVGRVTPRDELMNPIGQVSSGQRTFDDLFGGPFSVLSR